MVTLLRHLGLGLVLGVLTGVEARGFMALLAEYPEFTWEGTLSILGIFAIAGVALAAAYDLKLRGRSRWWKLLALPAVVLGLGQGMVLIPGILALALVMARRRWVRLAGVLLGLAYLVAMPALLGTSGQSLTPPFVAGIAGLVVCCAAIAAGLRTALTGWAPGRSRWATRNLDDRRHSQGRVGAGVYAG